MCLISLLHHWFQNKYYDTLIILRASETRGQGLTSGSDTAEGIMSGKNVTQSQRVRKQISDDFQIGLGHQS